MYLFNWAFDPVNQDTNENKTDVEKQTQIELASKEPVKLDKYGKPLRKKDFNNQYKFARYVWNEYGYCYLFAIFCLNFYPYFLPILNVNCQFQYPKRNHYCSSNYDFQVAVGRDIFNYEIGAIAMIWYVVMDNFSNDLGIINTIYLGIVLIVSGVMKYYSLDQKLFQNAAFLCYLIFVKCKKGFRCWNFLERIYLGVFYLVIFQIWNKVIYENSFNLDTTTRTLIANFYMGTQKRLIIKTFMMKSKFDIQSHEGVRIMIIIMFLQDIGNVFGQLVTKKLEDQAFLFGNFFVMSVFNLSGFHLWTFIAQWIVKTLGRIVNSQWIKNCLLKVIERYHQCMRMKLDIIFNDCMQAFYKQEPGVIDKPPRYSEAKISQILASYMVIVYILQFIFQGFVLIYQVHMPIMSNNCMMTYDKKQVAFSKDYKIDKKVYDLNLLGYSCVVGIYLFSFITVFIYGKFKGIKYFKRHKMNKFSVLYQIPVSGFFFFLCTAYSFK